MSKYSAYIKHKRSVMHYKKKIGMYEKNEIDLYKNSKEILLFILANLCILMKMCFTSSIG